MKWNIKRSKKKIAMNKTKQKERIGPKNGPIINQENKQKYKMEQSIRKQTLFCLQSCHFDCLELERLSYM